MKKQLRLILLAVLIFAISAGWKILLLALDVVPFNADEAVVGLMARHILQGELPTFFYGQSYMGSLDAFLVAGGFLLFGQQVWVIRLIQVLLYLVFLATTIQLGKEILGSVKTGLLAAALLAIPTVNLTLYSTASLGGYGEALVIGNLVFLVSWRLAHDPEWKKGLMWGFLVGFGLWANGLTLVYSLPGLILVAWGMAKKGWKKNYLALIGLVLLGGIAGALPWWYYAATQGIDRLVTELLGTAVAVENVSWLERTGLHLVNFLLLGLPAAIGLRPPWSVGWLVLPLLPLALMVWLVVMYNLYRKSTSPGDTRPAYVLLGGVCGTLTAGFLFTAFGVDPSGRYFLPLAVPLALCAADLFSNLKRPVWMRYGVLALLVVYQLGGNLQVALKYPPGFTTQFDRETVIEHRYDEELIAFLRQNGEMRGYTNYWVSYPLAFKSGEDLIFIPRLPYHTDLRYTSRDNRYKPYTREVDSSPRVAYITTRNAALDRKLIEGFQHNGVTYQEKLIGDFHVFYHLSSAVRPVDLGIQDLQP